MSNDHKPDLEAERERIIRCNGRVEKMNINGIKSGPYRVWLKEADYPGLSLSRSIGDLCAATIGVTCEPEIIDHDMTNEIKYIVLASDGVWEFITNRRIMELVNNLYKNGDVKSACSNIVEEATILWKIVSPKI